MTQGLSFDEDVTISTLPNKDGAWSLIVQSIDEQFYLNITANHNLRRDLRWHHHYRNQPNNN